MRNWKAWAGAAAVRAIRAAAKNAICCIGAAAVLSEVQWSVAISAAVLAGVLSLLTSIADLPEVKQDE